MTTSKAFQRATASAVDLSPYATTSAMTTALAAKADSSAMTTALAAKADAANVVQPGHVGYTTQASAPSGWVVAAGRTIGDASSGATERANADTATLFAIIWALDSTLFPITDSAGSASTRGANAAADFAAHKRLPLPDLRGRVLAGLDTITGPGAANRLTTAGGGVDGTKIGAVGGAETHTLTTAQMPQHAHTATYDGTAGSSTSGNRVMTTSAGNGQGTWTSSNQGSNAAHNNTQPTITGLPIIKL